MRLNSTKHKFYETQVYYRKLKLNFVEKKYAMWVVPGTVYATGANGNFGEFIINLKIIFYFFKQEPLIYTHDTSSHSRARG